MSDLVREGLTLRFQHTGPMPEPMQNGSSDNISYTSYTATQRPSDTAAALADLREMVQAQAARIDTLIAMLEHWERRPVTLVPSSNTVIPLRAPQATVPNQAAVPTDAHSAGYGALTDQVLEAAQRLRRFTAAELARTIGAQPKAVHEVLARYAKRQDGTLRRDGRYFVVES
jgi:hypothetical protein